MKVPPQTVYNALMQAGANATEADTLTAVATAESQLETTARNYNPPREDSRGIFQLNLIAHPDISVECATTVLCSAGAAYRLYKARGNYNDWTMYTNGGYKQYLGQGKSNNGNPAPGETVGQGGQYTDAPPASANGGETVGQGGQYTSTDLQGGIKDALIVFVALGLSVGLALIGAYGLATGQESYGGTIRHAQRTTARAAKTAAKVAALV